jgi:hypothetical protein
MQLSANAVGVEEFFFHGDITNAVVGPAAGAEIVSAARLAELHEALVTAFLVGFEIGGDTMLGTGLAAAAEFVSRITPGAVLVADRRPVAIDALFTAHRCASAEHRNREHHSCINQNPVHDAPRLM